MLALTSLNQNWGDVPFPLAVQSWYWGHGTLGPYDLVWFDAIDATGKESVSGYLLQNGKVVSSTCTAGAKGLKVRPIGTAYPPKSSTPTPRDFNIVMELGHGAVLNATAMAVSEQLNAEIYTRWVGGISGLVNGTKVAGPAVWEQFQFAS
jgi:hypothetical protein